MRHILVLPLLLLAMPTSAQAPEWQPPADSAARPATLEDAARLTQAFPDSSSVALRLLNALANSGDTATAGQVALVMASRGHAFSEASEEVIAGFLDRDLADSFGEVLRASRVPLEASEVIDTIPAAALLVEGILRDPLSGDLYATTVVSRNLWRKRGGQPWEALELQDAGSLSGLALDPASGLIWLASGNFEQTPGEPVGSALLGFDPRKQAVVRRLPTGTQGALGEIAVGGDGTIFVGDPVSGAIYRAGPRDRELSQLVGPGTFRSPQGMVAVPNRNLLVVSDYRYGLAAVDLDEGSVSRLTGGGGIYLDGIDALLARGRSLIAVQNGASPKRILQFDMSRDWLVIEQATLIESAHGEWTEPLGASLDHAGLIYIANGQWDRFDPGGGLKDGAAAVPTQIRLLPLGD